MWIFTKDGFFSAVKDKHYCKADEIMVRARCREDLVRMLKRLHGKQLDRLKLADGIIELPHADYRFRCKRRYMIGGPTMKRGYAMKIKMAIVVIVLLTAGAGARAADLTNMMFVQGVDTRYRLAMAVSSAKQVIVFKYNAGDIYRSDYAVVRPGGDVFIEGAQRVFVSSDRGRTFAARNIHVAWSGFDVGDAREYLAAVQKQCDEGWPINDEK